MRTINVPRHSLIGGVAFIFTLCTIVLDASADTLRPAPGSNLAGTIQSARTNDRIELAAGDYSGPIIIDGKSITIAGAGADQTRITGEGQTIAAAVNDGELVLEGLTLSGKGQTDFGFIGQGGALTGRSIAITDVKRGFVQQQAKSVALSDTSLQGSGARGLVLTEGTQAQLSNVTMSGVGGDVGIFLADQSRLTVTGSTLSDVNEHVFYADGSTLELRSTDINKLGGRVLVAQNAVQARFEDVTISDVRGDAAIFAAPGSRIAIANGDFSKLTGMGVYGAGAELIVSDTRFEELGAAAIASANGRATLRSNSIISSKAAFDIQSGEAVIERNEIAKTAARYPAISISGSAVAQVSGNTLRHVDYGIAVSAAKTGDVAIKDNAIIMAGGTGLQVRSADNTAGNTVIAENNLIISSGRNAVSAAEGGSLILRGNRILSSGDIAVLAVENSSIEASGNLIGAKDNALYADTRTAARIEASGNRIVSGTAPSSASADIDARLYRVFSEKAAFADPLQQAFTAVFDRAKADAGLAELSAAIDALEARYAAIGSAVAEYRASSPYPAAIPQPASPLPLALADPARFHEHIVDPDGRLFLQFRDLAFPARGRPLEIVRSYSDGAETASPLGAGWSWNWGQEVLRAGRRQLTFRQADGGETAFVKAKDGGYVPQIGPAGSAFIDRDGGLFERRFANGLSDVFTGGRFSLREGRDGPAQFLTYDGDRLRTVESVAGRALRFAYDEDGRLLRADGPEGSSAFTAYRYTDGLLTGVDDALGRQTRFAYDDAGLLSGITFADGSELVISRGDDGRITALAGPGTLSSTVTRSYDPASGLFERTIEDATGRKHRQTATPLRKGGLKRTYGLPSFEISTRIETGALSASIADAEPVTLKLPSPDDSLSASGGLVQHDLSVGTAAVPAGNEFDGSGFPKSLSFDGETAKAAYSSAGRPVTLTAQDGTQRPVAHDAAGQLSAISGGETGEHRFRYDPAGRLVEAETGAGVRRIRYTPEGLVQRVEGPDATWTYSHDAAGRITKVENGDQFVAIDYDDAGVPASYTDEQGNTLKFTRERAGQVKMTMPDGKTAEIETGSDGLPRKLTSDGALVAAFARAENGQIVAKRADGPSELLAVPADAEAVASDPEWEPDLATSFVGLAAGTAWQPASSSPAGMMLNIPPAAGTPSISDEASSAFGTTISPSATWAGTALAAAGAGGMRLLGPVNMAHNTVSYLNGDRSTTHFVAGSAAFGLGLAVPGNPVSAAAAAHALGGMIGEALAEHVINEINDPNSRDGRIYERLFGVHREEQSNHPCSQGINCDCGGIEAGLLTGPWRQDCRNCQRGLRERCMRAVAAGTSSEAAVAASPRCRGGCSVYGDNYRPR